MSQITRCPQCQTRFKVVDDQLRISDGWVRCGKCKSVFDALAHLVQRPDAGVVENATDKPAAAPEATPVVAATEVRNHVDVAPIAAKANADAIANLNVCFIGTPFLVALLLCAWGKISFKSQLIFIY